MASLRLCLGTPQVGSRPNLPAWTCNMTCPASGPLCPPFSPDGAATFLVGSREWLQVVGSACSPPLAWGPLPVPGEPSTQQLHAQSLLAAQGCACIHV